MDEVKRRYKVTLDGRSYTIISTNTPAHMNAVVELINHQLAEIKKIMPGADGQQMAMLVALNAVSDQLALQRKLNTATKADDPQ